LLGEADVPLAGFTTEELREGRRRVGFGIETFAGERATLAHVDFPGPPRVSKYGVDLEAFERLALPALAGARAGDVVLVDELGKMELASEAFCSAVTELFEGPATIIATVQIARHPFTDALKTRSDVETIRVTTENRGELPAQLASRFP
jgi:nucleoside-triphosphatase